MCVVFRYEDCRREILEAGDTLGVPQLASIVDQLDQRMDQVPHNPIQSCRIFINTCRKMPSTYYW